MTEGCNYIINYVTCRLQCRCKTSECTELRELDEFEGQQSVGLSMTGSAVHKLIILYSTKIMSHQLDMGEGEPWLLLDPCYVWSHFYYTLLIIVKFINLFNKNDLHESHTNSN